MFNNKFTAFTSGNLIYENEKFEMMEEMFGESFETKMRRCVLDQEQDMKIFNYSYDYLNNPNFQRSKVGIDMALTKFINPETFPVELERFVEQNPNLIYMGLKTMALGLPDTDETRWLKQHLMNEDEMARLYENMSARFPNDGNSFKVCDIDVSHKVSGDWAKYVILSGGQLMKHDGTILTIQDMKEMSKLKTSKDAEPLL